MAITALLISAVLLLWLIATLNGGRRAMPAGLSVASPLCGCDDIAFLTDLTYVHQGQLRCEQQILPEILAMIHQAESFIVLDIFLYNDLHHPGQDFPPLSRIMTEALLAALQRRPGLRVYLISDPTNTGYGSYPNPYFEALQAAGATVVISNLDLLPDSNLPYSGLWNLLARHLAGAGRAWLPSPFAAGSPPFSLGGWLALLNFKANHRKVVITEQAGLITSANNSHDASAANSNIAFRFSGPLLAEVLKSEAAVTALSGIRLDVVLPTPSAPSTSKLQLQLLTEGKIKETLLADLQNCQPPATLWLAMFYLADRQIITALLAAAQRGITLRLILDANRHAFGRQKNGVPNRPVAAWLHQRSAGRIQIRWYRSHAEQFHSKLLLLSTARRSLVLGGSANLTRRNIADYNLESCLRIDGPSEHAFHGQVLGYFERLWANDGGEFTMAYEEGADTSRLKYWQYELQERSGFSLF